MKLAVIALLIIAVASAIVLVQTGVRFSPEAAPRVKKPVPLSKVCTTDSDCKINTYCPPNAKCVRFFDTNVTFSCQQGKCVANVNE